MLKTWLRRIVIVGVGLSMAGCAKYPSNGGSQFTKITFNIEMAGPLNPQYLYYVAMYTSTDLNPPVQIGPSPVVGTGAPNGWMTGQATNYVKMDLTQGQPFQIYSVGSPTDPGALPDTYIGSTNDQILPDTSGTLPSKWSFSVYTNELTGGNDSLANQLKSITFQIVTMNKLQLGGTSGRIMDAIGPNTSFQAESFRIDLSGTYSNELNFLGIEPANDTVGGYDPALDIVDFSVTVSVPPP